MASGKISKVAIIRHKPTGDELAAKLANASAANVCDLGGWSRVLIGAAAAAPAMVLFRPESTFALNN
ncbi:hypothetical protein H6G36_27080 [Anabaena minutissima FACHB-250]|nr:hypothetical protein [Anabaena minutissima FACHB-250]